MLPRRAPPLLSTLVALVVLVLLAAPRSARAQLPLLPGSWAVFEWFLGAGPVDGAGFALDATARMQIRVTDAGVTGDAFDVFVNGAPTLGTPTVADGVVTGTFDGASAWADARLSRGSFFLNPGQYTITLAVRETADGFDFGEGFIRADLAPLPPPPPPVTGVPEPATGALIAGGLALLGLRAVRRRLTQA